MLKHSLVDAKAHLSQIVAAAIVPPGDVLHGKAPHKQPRRPSAKTVSALFAGFGKNAEMSAVADLLRNRR